MTKRNKITENKLAIIILSHPMVFLMKKKKKPRVKNIFIQKVNSSVSLEEKEKEAQKQKQMWSSVKTIFKAFMKT